MTVRASPEPELRIFGGPLLVAAAAPISLSPFQLALLTIVFAEERIERPDVARILWRRDDSPRVRQRIRQLLHLTNSRLGTRAIVANGDALTRGEAFASDVARYEAAVEGGDLRTAARLVASGFACVPLPGVEGEFRDWAEAFERRLRRKLSELAVGKWEDATQGASWDEAYDAAECLYLLRRADATSVERVIDARARAGKTGSAEAAYATYLEALSEGVAPGPGVVAAIERARKLRAQARREGGFAPPPFVGRVEAMRAGRSVLEGMRDNHFSFLLVTGEAGIGKTRVLEELEREAVLRDLRCVRASPVELEYRVPLNPFLDALSSVDLRPHLEALGEPWSTVIASTLPVGSYEELAGELPPIQESSLPRRLLDAYALLLEELASERATVFFLDDLQWADATTVAALQFAQRRWSRGSFLVVASLRTEMGIRSGPALTYLQDQEGLEVHRVEIGELSHADGLALITGIGGDRVDPPAAQRLCELAGLHPLYLTELTRDFLSGRMKLQDYPASEVTIPVSLKQIFATRIDGLSDDAMKIAGLLAVRAKAIRLREIAGLLRMSVDECADRIEELDRGRLITVQQDRVSISHELFRSALYAHLSDARRALMHMTIAELLLAEDAERDAGELAIHLARAGEAEAAAKWGWAAAARAWDDGALAEAAYYFGLVAETERCPEKSALATAGRARSLYLIRDLPRANPALLQASKQLRGVGLDGPARRLSILRVQGLAAEGSAQVPGLLDQLLNIRAEAEMDSDWEAVALSLNAQLKLLHRLGDIPRIVQLFDLMRSTADHGTDAAVLCNAGLAMQALFGSPEHGLECARRAVALAPPDSEHRLTALRHLLVVLQYQGRMLLEEAESVLMEARQLSEKSGDRWARFGIESNFALALSDAGELDRAEVLIQPLAKRQAATGFDLAQFGQPINLAELALAQGRFDDAIRWYRVAEAHLQANSPRYARDLITAGVGLCALETGNLSEARRREAELGRPPSPWYYDPTTVLTFRAKLDERRGRRASAITMLDEQDADLRRRHLLAWLKIGLVKTRLLEREGRGRHAAAAAVTYAASAAELRLFRRVRQFNDIASRLHG